MSQLEFRFDPRAVPRAKPAIEPWIRLAKRLLDEQGCRGMAELVSVKWNGRLRSAAGRALYAKSLVELNPRLAEFGDREIEITLRHELAHLLAHERAGRKRIAPHGKEWRIACRDLGIDGEKACHTLPLPRRQVVRGHLYRCPACRGEIRRVRPFRRAVACWSCCRRFSRGKYDEKFRLVKVPV